MNNRTPPKLFVALLLVSLAGCATNPDGGAVRDYDDLQKHVGQRITVAGKPVNGAFGFILNARGLSAYSTQPWPAESVPNKTIQATGVLQSSLSAEHPFVLTHVTWPGLNTSGLPTTLYLTWPGGAAVSAVVVTVNGASREIPDGTSITALLALHKLTADKVAVELNRRLIRTPDYTRILQSGDQIEIVTFVGGG